MDLTLGAIAQKVAEGLPIAAGLFLLLLAGHRGVWRWNREYIDNDTMWRTRYEENDKAWRERLQDSQRICDEWKDLAKRGIGAAETLAPAVAARHENAK